MNIEWLWEDPRFVFKMKVAQKGRDYDKQQDVTTTASDESEADLGRMNSFIYLIQNFLLVNIEILRMMWMVS